MTATATVPQAVSITIGVGFLLLAFGMFAFAAVTELLPRLAGGHPIDVVATTCPDCYGAGEVVTNPDAPSFAHEVADCPNPECNNGEVQHRG